MNSVYSETQTRKYYKQLTEYLIAHNLTITTMESATSGLIASLITDTPGASSIMKGAFITYSNEAKIMQGIAPDILEKYTVYSKETAHAMALSCQNTYHTNIGIGVTGTMGNVDPANASASVPGEVFFSIAFDSLVYDYRIELSPQPSRYLYKIAVAQEIVLALLKLLKP